MYIEYTEVLNSFKWAHFVAPGAADRNLTSKSGCGKQDKNIGIQRLCVFKKLIRSFQAKTVVIKAFLRLVPLHRYQRI